MDTHARSYGQLGHDTEDHGSNNTFQGFLETKIWDLSEDEKGLKGENNHAEVGSVIRADYVQEDNCHSGNTTGKDSRWPKKEVYTYSHEQGAAHHVCK